VWMFLVIFLWTPPHFWALSLVLKQDYARANVPMLPVVMGERETHKQIILYTLLLLAATLVLFATQAMGYLYLAAALLLGSGLLVLALLLALVVRLLKTRTLANARQFFWFSNYYLALIFALMVVDRVLR
ncbi:MAG TPA: UbiA family prenyltransferase, partial [Ktedonobacterales bacterium]|nr:UbiA family prenyltransferase [Ktedonobacterales bacterium]